MSLTAREELVSACADMTAAVVAIASHAMAHGGRVEEDLSVPFVAASKRLGAAYQGYQAEHPHLAVVQDLFDQVPLVKTCGLCDTPLRDERGDVCGHCHRDESA